MRQQKVQLWNILCSDSKFNWLLHFGRVPPAIRLQVEKGLALQGLPLEKVLATTVALMERTNIRVGSAFYEKLYGSFGLTTLKDIHVTVNGIHISFSFKGKKGLSHLVSLKSRKLSRIVQQCREIPGKELFQYLDEKSQLHVIDSGMVNEYIKNISGEDFTAKDFRTWAGTLQALLGFQELYCVDTDAEIKRNIVRVIDKVSAALGNTRTVCRKYYVHPILITLYENRQLPMYIASKGDAGKNNGESDLTPEEKMLIKILESNLYNNIMRAIWTGAISFGLVNIPVKLYSAINPSELDLDMLDKKDHANIKFKRVNERTGKEVPWENIVRGYLLNDRYVVLDKKEFENASPKQTKTIEIMDFAEEEEIDSLYYEVPYYLEPEKSGVRAYALLRESLKKSKKVGIATFVLRNKQSLGVIKIEGDAIILMKIRFTDEIRGASELNIPGKITVKPNELKMAVALIEQFTKPFDVDAYKDTYSAALMKLIKAKAKGGKTHVPTMRVVHSTTRDLMEQLKASLNVKKKKAS